MPRAAERTAQQKNRQKKQMEDQTTEQVVEIATEPPCRAASKYQTQCPTCRRPMSIKHLRYAHRCNKTWDIDARAAEQDKLAKEAVLARARAQKDQKEKWAMMQPSSAPYQATSSAWSRSFPAGLSATQQLRRRLR